MDRKIHCILQGGNQGIGCFRFQKACHILNGNDIGSRLLHFLSQVGVVLEGILLTPGIHNIAGVAEAGFGNLVLLPYLINGYGHVVQLVQAVEDSEYVNTVVCSLVDEMTNHVFRIVGIADGIGAAGKHLEENVGRCLPHLPQAVPGAFI